MVLAVDSASAQVDSKDMFDSTDAIFPVAHIRSPEALPPFLNPEKGNTFGGEMQCYGLPYGGLGFASHILTYYTLICIWNRVRPHMPWKTMTRSFWKFNFVLGALQLMISVGIAVFTIIRCRNGWEFMLLAIWKIFMSATLGFSAISAALWTRNRRPERHLDTIPLVNYAFLSTTDIDLPLPDRSYSPAKYLNPRDPSTGRNIPYSRANTDHPTATPQPVANWIRNANWIWLYFPGLLAGLVGLFRVVNENWNTPKVSLITYIMFGIPAGIIILGVLGGVCIVAMREDCSWLAVWVGGILGLIGYGAIGLAVVGALYSDWVLGAISGDLAGVPSDDNKYLFWGYFVAKRLPLASI